MAATVLMRPGPGSFDKHESGIRRVVEAYAQFLPQFGFEITADLTETIDLVAVHAGSGKGAEVCHCHGLYWTGDLRTDKWETKANRYVIESARSARQITVPSTWVAKTFQREMRVSPHVIGHGIEADQWKHDEPNLEYVLWNKNRAGIDVCDPYPITDLAIRFPSTKFMTTFSRPDPPGNVQVTGILPHKDMKQAIQRAGVYLATTKETFGIGILEAMASGIPVLGFDYGGITDLVQHGVNGYLAVPGNYDDLADGLVYCAKNREGLGANGAYLAEAYLWENVAEQVAGVYRLSMKSSPSTVSVIIPTYNYAHMIERAVRSVMAQTYNMVHEIIIVDDGSTDDTIKIVEALVKEDTRVHFLRQDNMGVAHARNNGISHATGKYILCLDADDMLDPRYIEACVPALDEDRSLGIAYTGLQWIKPDGSTGLSPWPGEFDYNQQLKRRNQIPTACLFRREMWERLGGYKQRYAPGGAGSEDAEFWLRAGAYGWNAKKVTEAGLFIYSWMSGNVTGNPDYHETDWLAWHPWVEDEKHPFVSVASPANKWSHPVRQYDNPAVSVVIPVGNGHEKEVETALDSLEAQTFRKWEAIVVYDNDMDMRVEKKAYPYVTWLGTDKPGSGAGTARNIGVDHAEAGFLLFLDADDFLFPEALRTMIDEWNHTGYGVYSDYVGRAYIDDPEKLASNLEIIERDDDGNTAILYTLPDFDCERAKMQPANPPFIWNNITTLIPRSWHDEVGGFDESMKSWEDVDYWWRMAWLGKCFTKINTPLMMYKFYSGGRREVGLNQWENLLEYLAAKKEGIDIMACNCKEKNTKPQPAPMMMQESQGEETMIDDDYVMVQYISPNKGQHGVKGMHTGTFYGYRGGGEKFLVNRQDIALQPHLFVEIDKAPITPVEVIRATPPPQRIVEEAPVVEEPEVYPPYDSEMDFQVLPGVTPVIANRMVKAGFRTAEDLKARGADGLSGAIKGIGELKAQMIMDYVSSNY